jgi:hypothetical protein
MLRGLDKDMHIPHAQQSLFRGVYDICAEVFACLGRHAYY